MQINYGVTNLEDIKGIDIDDFISQADGIEYTEGDEFIYDTPDSDSIIFFECVQKILNTELNEASIIFERTGSAA